MKSFKNITGNEFIIKFLKNAIQYNKVSHAYIISGGEGCGKTLIAETFAKTLQCEKGGTDACCECISCKSFENRNNPDIFYVVPNKKSKTKSIGVTDIREQVIDVVSVKPYKYKYKIFIIENADNMTKEAQNAFLKTLEEPPMYSIFLLMARNPEKFLPTILSRCVNIKIRPLSSGYVYNYIMNNTDIPEEKIQLFTEYAQGSIGKALKLANSQEFIDMRDKIINTLIGLYGKNEYYASEAVSVFEEYKKEKGLLDMMYLWYRDILAAKVLKDDKYIIQKDKKDIIFKEANKYSAECIIDKTEACLATKNQILKNVNFRLCMEVLLMKLKESY